MLYYSKNFLTFTGKHLSEIFKNAYFEEQLQMVAPEFSKIVFKELVWHKPFASLPFRVY